VSTRSPSPSSHSQVSRLTVRPANTCTNKHRHRGSEIHKVTEPIIPCLIYASPPSPPVGPEAQRWNLSHSGKEKCWVTILRSLANTPAGRARAPGGTDWWGSRKIVVQTRCSANGSAGLKCSRRTYIHRYVCLWVCVCV
jgi:hypothetical protein